MDDHEFNELSDSETESTDSDESSWLAVALDEWQAWLVGAAAVLVAGYFSANRGIWENNAEAFYVVIFAVVALVALGYGLNEVRSRATSF